MSTLTAAFDLPPSPSSVPVARHLATELLRAWQAPHDAEDAALLVTQLVPHVVDHVGGEASFPLELTLSDGWLRIAAVDGSAIPPVVREPDPARPRGRGMRLVTAIADRWAAEDHRGGKRVWFELSPPGR